MLDQINIHNILFIDIETVPVKGQFEDLSPEMKDLWEHKHSRLRIDEEMTASESFFDRGGIFAEFGKIICISCAIMPKADDKTPLGIRIKSFYGDDERELLLDFCDMLNKHYNDSETFMFCGHNIKEFDVPYISRRMLVNGVSLPNMLDLYGKRPWEVNHLDTLHMWRFGDYKSYTSLKLLTTLFDIPTPKDDIDGKDVGLVYWKNRDLQRIVTYCQKDVLAVAKLVLKFKGLPLIEDDKIEYIS